jgi:hypothetical protein
MAESSVKNKAGFPIYSFCRTCGEDFSGDDIFARHRVGTHEYLYAEGLEMDPPREDGRRCLDVDEMEAKGWRLNKRGRWADPVKAEQAARMRRASAEKAS